MAGLAIGNVAGCDGHGDLLLGGQNAPELRVRCGDGRGGFAPFGGPWTVAGASGQLAGLVGGDFDGDGDFDVVGALPSMQSVAVFLGDSAEGFLGAQTYAAGGDPRQIRLGDVTCDDRPDLVVATAGGVRVLVGDGTGRFGAAGAPLPGTVGVTDVALVDINGDARLDLVVAAPGGISTYQNGCGSFTATQTAPGAFVALAVGDFTADGVLDVAAAKAAGGVIVFFNLAMIGTANTEADVHAAALASVDIDGDGDDELVVLTRQHVTVFLGDHDGALTEDASAPVGDDLLPMILIGDLLASSLPDVILLAPGSDRPIVIIENVTTVAFTPTPTPAPQGCVGDCNEDGQVAINELVVGVNIALEQADVSICRPFDNNRSEGVEVNELVMGVNNALGDCPP